MKRTLAVAALTLVLAACGGHHSSKPSTPTPQPGQQPGSPQAPTGDFQGQELQLINQYRAQNGLAALSVDTRLTSLAQAHSQDMANRHTMDHAGFDQRFKQAQTYGYTHCIENVAWNFSTPQALFNAWRNSPEHDKNMKDPAIRQAGISIISGYATLDACN